MKALGTVAQLVRAAGLYPVLASDKRKVVGSSPTCPTIYNASIAQWIEHRSSKPRVAGSNPARGATLIFQQNNYCIQGVVVELVDTTDSKSVALRRAGSIPANPTTRKARE